MTETQLKCTTRHVRLFTSRLDNDELIPDPSNITLDLDPDNEFIWNDQVIKKVHKKFEELISSQAGQDLTEYKLRKIGSDLEGIIRELVQLGELSYNPECRVLNYSMGLPRTPDLL